MIFRESCCHPWEVLVASLNPIRIRPVDWYILPPLTRSVESLCAGCAFPFCCNCEFDAVNLTWMTHTNREALARLNHHSPPSSWPYGSNSANRALEHAPGKWFVGLWVPARVSPERTSNLECGLFVVWLFQLNSSYW